ncbi:hypothetical protein Tco_1386469 [Tanacetum coccineum]
MLVQRTISKKLILAYSAARFEEDDLRPTKNSRVSSYLIKIPAKSRVMSSVVMILHMLYLIIVEVLNSLLSLGYVHERVSLKSAVEASIDLSEVVVVIVIDWLVCHRMHLVRVDLCELIVVNGFLLMELVASEGNSGWITGVD